MSYKMEVIADSSKTWVGNSQRFATSEEAAGYAMDLKSRWTLVIDTRVVASTDPVNARFANGKVMPLWEKVAP